MSNLDPLMSSASPDWQTPDCVLDIVRLVAPIGLDPCTTRENPVRAARYYTPTEDGLAGAWDVADGELVYVNPPYGRGIAPWVARCGNVGDTVVALLPARVDTRWFPWDADALCFWRGRLRFRDAPAPAPFPSAVALWANTTAELDRFCSAFGDVGKIIVNARISEARVKGQIL